MKEFEIALPIGHAPAEAELRQAAGRALGVKPERVAAVRIVRRSLDARGEILYRYRVEACAQGETLEEYSLLSVSFPAIPSTGFRPFSIWKERTASEVVWP